MRVLPRIVLAVSVVLGVYAIYVLWDPAALLKASVTVGGKRHDVRVYDKAGGVYGSSRSGHMTLLVPSEQVRKRPIGVSLVTVDGKCELKVDGRRFRVKESGNIVPLE